MSIQTIETMVKWVESNAMENPSLLDMSSYVGYCFPVRVLII
jgi:hypothetical protein